MCFGDAFRGLKEGSLLRIRQRKSLTKRKGWSTSSTTRDTDRCTQGESMSPDDLSIWSVSQAKSDVPRKSEDSTVGVSCNESQIEMYLLKVLVCIVSLSRFGQQPAGCMPRQAIQKAVTAILCSAQCRHASATCEAFHGQRGLRQANQT